MDEPLIERIRVFARSQTSPLPYPIATEAAVAEAERQLGFPLPVLLRACYLKVGNGGFGPGYGLIGLEGGYSSDYGFLVETYGQLKSDQKSEGREWMAGLLPFCEWGCNIFSCVDCRNPQHPIHTFEDFATLPQKYDLGSFFENWMSGRSLLDQEAYQEEDVEITNPFSGRKTKASRRKRG